MTVGGTLKSPLTWLGGLLVVYLGYPIAGFVVRLVTSRQRGFHAPGLFPALWVSVAGATMSLALVTLCGLPLAYVLARSKGRLGAVVGVLVQIPLALPPLMSGVVLVYLIGPYTFLGQHFGEHLTDSMVGVVIAMSFVSAPFLLVAARAAFSGVEQGMLDVARTLGYSDVSRFVRVAVPSAGHGIRAGMLLTWLRAFGEYGAVVILAYNPASLPIYTYNQFSGRGLPTTLAPTALALAVAVVVVVVSRVSVRVPSSRPTIVSRPRPPAPVRTQPVRFALDHRLGDFHLRVAHESRVNHLAVLGPSGSGKSALLRCLAGLYGPGPGPVWYGDRPVSDVPVERRGVGYVAQGFALFPHLNVWRHLTFARESNPELASYWLEHLRLDGLESRMPSELSGGQRQRVGLAQVLCQSPQVLLLDEPFSALDAPVRLELRRELRRVQRETGLATVLVTHDAEEAAFLSDELMVIARGEVLQSGASRSVFSRPVSPEVALLVGVENVQVATVVSSTALAVGDARVAILPTTLALGTRVHWSVRPEHVEVAATTNSSVAGDFEGRVIEVVDTGLAYELVVEFASGGEIRARSSGLPEVAPGELCRVHLRAEAVSVWLAALE
ncbi:MAG TPA: ATP-binding cassette domain-containing protein [Acidimicrobiales bacterium]|nr:ATP-binding cassette domain-containing protein [Acidimicrobiales bacterium]